MKRKHGNIETDDEVDVVEIDPSYSTGLTAAQMLRQSVEADQSDEEEKKQKIKKKKKTKTQNHTNKNKSNKNSKNNKKMQSNVKNTKNRSKNNQQKKKKKQKIKKRSKKRAVTEEDLEEEGLEEEDEDQRIEDELEMKVWNDWRPYFTDITFEQIHDNLFLPPPVDGIDPMTTDPIWQIPKLGPHYTTLYKNKKPRANGQRNSDGNAKNKNSSSSPSTTSSDHQKRMASLMSNRPSMTRSQSSAHVQDAKKNETSSKISPMKRSNDSYLSSTRIRTKVDRLSPSSSPSKSSSSSSSKSSTASLSKSSELKDTNKESKDDVKPKNEVDDEEEPLGPLPLPNLSQRILRDLWSNESNESISTTSLAHDATPHASLSDRLKLALFEIGTLSKDQVDKDLLAQDEVCNEIKRLQAKLKQQIETNRSKRIQLGLKAIPFAQKQQQRTKEREEMQALMQNWDIMEQHVEDRTKQQKLEKKQAKGKNKNDSDGDES